jgi:DinB family protein
MARSLAAEAKLEPLREQLVSLLYGTEAHMSFEEAVAAFPAEAMNKRAPNVTYTPWHILEHLRLTQWDILEYMRDPRGHRSPEWPVGYWPAPDATTTPDGFRETVESFIADRAAVEQIVRDPSTDLTAVLSGTPGHTVVREVTILGNHNSYHVGEFAALRQVMASWPARRRR